MLGCAEVARSLGSRPSWHGAEPQWTCDSEFYQMNQKPPFEPRWPGTYLVGGPNPRFALQLQAISLKGVNCVPHQCTKYRTGHSRRSVLTTVLCFGQSAPRALRRPTCEWLTAFLRVSLIFRNIPTFGVC